MDKTASWSYVTKAPKPAVVVVRYKPQDPSQYRVLTEDNKNTLGFLVAIY